MKKIYLLFFLILFLSISTAVYTYTLTDLNLTLAENQLILDLQKKLQYFGYFRRNYSTIIYLFLITSWVVLYLIISKIKLHSHKFRNTIVILLIIPLMFSFSAFISYDIFNYIFDSKIITHYHSNPYYFSALDFANDPMLNFMRWTHRTYPYGPLWLIPGILITILTSKLLIQMFLFKILAITFLIYSQHILNKLNKKNELLYIFNPLIILEVLISGHNDVYIAFFTLLSIIIFHKKFLSILALISGGMIKFANIFLIPAFIFFKKPSEQFYISIYGFTVFSIILASIRSEFQPWYIIWLLPVAYLLKRRSILRTYTLIISMLLPLSYYPYIQTGTYDGMAYNYKYIILIISVPLSILLNRQITKYHDYF